MLSLLDNGSDLSLRRSWRENSFWRGNALGLVPASLAHTLGYACTFYTPTSPLPREEGGKLHKGHLPTTGFFFRRSSVRSLLNHIPGFGAENKSALLQGFLLISAVLRLQERFQNPRQTPVRTKFRLKRSPTQLTFPVLFSKCGVLRASSIQPKNLLIYVSRACLHERH